MATVGPRIVVAGAAGFTNLGDDAILAAMLTELRATLPHASFVVAGGPDPCPLDPPVEWIHVRDIRAVDAAVSRADLVIVGGGGFIFDYDGVIAPYDFLRGDITYMFPYYRATICARARDVPVYFYAVGIDSLVTPAGRALTRDVLSLASAITVRDAISLLELRQAGVSCPVVEVTADPAVRIDPPLSPWPARPDGRVVSLVVRPWLRLAGEWTPSAARYFAAYLRWVAAGADHAIEEWGATPVLVAGQRYADDDLDVARRVVERMRHGERAVVLGDVADEEEYRTIFAASDAVVSTRLHPLILAATADVPVVGITLSAKIRAFLLALELEQQSVSPWAASSRRLREALDAALGEGDRVRERLRAGLARMRDAAARNPALAVEVLASTRAGRRR